MSTVEGMSPVEAVMTAIRAAESKMGAYAKQESDALAAVTAAHLQAESAQRLQRIVGAELEGLRIAARRLAMQDADLLARFTGPETSVD